MNFFVSFFLISGQTETQCIRDLIRDYRIDVSIDEIAHTAPSPQQQQKASTSTMTELLAKHSRNGSSGDPPSCLEDEVTNFLQSAHGCNEVLEFWKKSEHLYPRLAIVAKSVLAIPITSACSESAFSVAGCLIRSRRASIAPHRVEKVLFVHDNYDLFHL